MLAGFAMIGLALESHTAGVDALVAFVVSSLSCAALPVALRHPLVATVLQCAAVALLDLGAFTPRTEFPVMLVAVVVAHVAVVALRHTWQIAVGVWWTLVCVAVVLVVVAVDEGGSRANETLGLAVLSSASLTALVGGIVYRYRQRIRGELAAARRDVEIEHERRTLVEERARIARELHDVVAHSMSVIHMQATSAPYRLAEVDPAVRAEFTAIASGARGALGEMRQLLGVLRESDAAAATDPAPGLDRLPHLVEATSRYGAAVTLVVEPELGHVPDTVGATTYRIVQEALSNVVRHARGAPATVRVERDADDLVVTVVNAAPGPAPGTDDAGPGTSVEELDDPGRPRHGVLGMGERVARLGGELAHGPQDAGGYRVTARIPLPTR